jgi:prevent-host-death family protein
LIKRLHLRDAKDSLSAVIEAAERGEATMITKNGRPAVVVPVEDARRRYPMERPSVVALLRDIPCEIDIARDPSPSVPRNRPMLCAEGSPTSSPFMRIACCHSVSPPRGSQACSLMRPRRRAGVRDLLASRLQRLPNRASRWFCL